MGAAAAGRHFRPHLSNCFIDFAEQFCSRASVSGSDSYKYVFLALHIDQLDAIWLKGKRIVGAAAADRLFRSHPSTLFGRRLPVSLAA